MSLKRVLIVDDAMELGRMYQDALRTTYPGVPVSFVPSAEEAMLEATRYTFDLMIVDIRLPGMSGVDLLRKIRARQPGIKAIMITGLKIDDELRKKVETVHADKLLRKPLGVSQFLGRGPIGDRGQRTAGRGARTRQGQGARQDRPAAPAAHPTQRGGGRRE